MYPKSLVRRERARPCRRNPPPACDSRRRARAARDAPGVFSVRRSAACAAASRATGTRIRRAADVVEADAVAEGDRLRVAAVLAADADLEVAAASRGRAARPSPSACPRPPGRSSRTGSRAGCAFSRYSRRKPVSASSREMPNVVCVRSLVPNEKNSASRAMSSAVSAARGISIIVPNWYFTRTPCSFITARASSSRIALLDLELVVVRGERDHDLRASP